MKPAKNSPAYAVLVSVLLIMGTRWDGLAAFCVGGQMVLALAACPCMGQT